LIGCENRAVHDEPHPLFGLLDAAARGRPPEPDGRVVVLGAAPGPVHAVVGFPFHNVVAADVDPDLVQSRLDPDDPGAALKADFLAWLSGRLGARSGAVDVVLTRVDGPKGNVIDLVPRDDLADHPRVQRAARYRTDLRVCTDPTGAGLAVVGRGLAGRWEVAFEVEPAARGQGLGRRLAAAAITLVPTGEALFVQTAPANTASLRALLAAGFQPLGGEVLFPKVGP
jgi:GNAT superfamily N-acetyltransferase